jgi:predicted lipid-binding transport protein (Tim44 family)
MALGPWLRGCRSMSSDSGASLPERADHRQRSRTGDPAPARSTRPQRHADFSGPILGVLCLGSVRGGLLEMGMGAPPRAVTFVLLALPLGTLLVWHAGRARHPRRPPGLCRDRLVVAAAMRADVHVRLLCCGGQGRVPAPSAIMASGNLATASG